MLALHAVMTTVLLRRTLAALEEQSNELPSVDVLVYRNQVSSLFKAVQQTLTQQIQLAIKAKRFEVHMYIHTYLSLALQNLSMFVYFTETAVNF